MEREQVGEKFDAFVATHATQISEIAQGMEGEQSHDWWPLYQEYTAQFDNYLEGEQPLARLAICRCRPSHGALSHAHARRASSAEFVSSHNTTKEEFLEAAAKAEGLNEFYLNIFLYHSEYEMFVELMAEQARKQAEELA